ncbi:hypothetical protein D3C71_1688830 [compost metagenome]
MPSAIIASKLRLLALIKRKLERRSSLPPTRWKVPSCSTRSSFTCTSAGMSPTSSKNRLPRSACSILPLRPLRSAPVKEPAS